MNAIAIITARGGSKRIPRKNIKLFCNKPIISYSIECAKDSGLFDTIMVSTDDEEIADISKSYGAEVPFFRSKMCSNDYSTTTDVLLEVIKEYESLGQTYKYTCCLYPTAPFINIENLKKSMDILVKEKAKCVIPIVEFSFPPQRAIVVKDGLLQYQYPQYCTLRSQDLETIYHDTGQFYFFETDTFLREKCLVMNKTAPLFISSMQAQDIDTIEDWKIAELKYRTLKYKA